MATFPKIRVKTSSAFSSFYDESFSDESLLFRALGSKFQGLYPLAGKPHPPVIYSTNTEKIHFDDENEKKEILLLNKPSLAHRKITSF